MINERQIKRSALEYSVIYVLLGLVWIWIAHVFVIPLLQGIPWQIAKYVKYGVFLLFSGGVVYFLAFSSGNKWVVMRGELAETKQKFESLINQTTDAIAIDDLDGNVIQINPAYERLYGWAAAEVLGRPVAVVPESHQEEYKYIFALVRSGGTLTSFETVRKRKDGSIIDISMTMSPLRDVKGNILAVASIVRDVSERNRTEEILRRSDKLAVAAQLAAGVAHEIRNPLTAIKGFTQLLKEKSNDSSTYFDIIQSEIGRVEEIIHEFLLISKPQAVHFQLEDIGHILQSVVTLLQTQAALHGVEIHLDIPSGFPLIRCAEGHLKQVFVNLVKNAIESMPSGGNVRVSTRRLHSQLVRITVMDEGCGIPPEQLRRLGEPYYTTKARGTGLGLMVSFKIIENHHGYVQVYSEQGHGTRMEVTLPIG